MSAALLSVLLATGWRAEFVARVDAGEIERAVRVAERERAPWFAPHLARGLPLPAHYIGWVESGTRTFAYRLEPATVREVHPGDPLAGVGDWLAESDRWVFAGDGFEFRTGKGIVHAFNARSAAVAAARVRQAHERSPTLFAYARSAPDDPRALPAAAAEVALAAHALDDKATILTGAGALDELRVAAYDGRLRDARFVVFAAHARATASGIALELGAGPDARFTAADTEHLQFNAELVVLSACASGQGADFARAAHRAGVGLVLLTRWPVDDAAAAQFIGALFADLGRGRAVAEALVRTQRAFADGRHGGTYRDPFFWAGWELWGG